MILRCDLVPQYRRFQAEIEAAMASVFASGRYVLGENVAAFEREFADYLGVRHVVALASGTDGLIMALKAVGVGPGDEVITTPFTAIPTASAIVAVGATPIFADIDPETFLIDLDDAVRRVGPRTRAIMPVHLFGNVVDVERLRSLLSADLPIIEDACQAHGSTLNGRQAGTFGRIGAFSFYPTKNLGAMGDGGALVTDSDEIAESVRLKRMYGMTDKDHSKSPGINSRLDEVQAAILRIKLRHLDEMNGARAALATRYVDRLPSAAFRPQKLTDGAIGNFHVYACRFAGDRDRLMNHLEKRGVRTNVYYPLPMYRQEFLRTVSPEPEPLPHVEAVCREIIALPMYPELAVENLDSILAIIASTITDISQA